MVDLQRALGSPRQTRSEHQFTANDYHKSTDVIQADWDLAGGVQDVGLLYTVGRRLADGKEYPSFYPTSEFRKLQDARLKGNSK